MDATASCKQERPYFAVIVGAGLSGAIVAERIATVLGKRVCVVDKRDHVAGNIFDEVDEESGIRVSRYGAHLFHTNDVEVWEHMQKFGAWRRWDHRVLTRVGTKLVPVPANINTVNTLFGTNLTSEADMAVWMAHERVGKEEDATNSEEVALARVGPRLYDALIKTYTRKQWGVGAHKLDALVLKRIPVRDNFDDRYFGDRFQALPEHGYTSIVERMLDHPLIDVKLSVDFFEHRAALEASCERLIYTGPVDSFFPKAGLPSLQYRSIVFDKCVVPCSGYVQPCSVLNYADDSTPFTRTVEYKHFLHQTSEKSVLVSETTTDVGEPYYPMPTARNVELYGSYQSLVATVEASRSLPRVKFLGRLATYKYINMDGAVRFALDAFKELQVEEETGANTALPVPVPRSVPVPAVGTIELGEDTITASALSASETTLSYGKGQA